MKDKELKAINEKDFYKAISHFEYVTNYYPKKIGRFHLLLGKSYLE